MTLGRNKLRIDNWCWLLYDLMSIENDWFFTRWRWSDTSLIAILIDYDSTDRILWEIKWSLKRRSLKFTFYKIISNRLLCNIIRRCIEIGWSWWFDRAPIIESLSIKKEFRFLMIRLRFLSSEYRLSWSHKTWLWLLSIW